MNDFVVACVVLAIVWALVEFVRSFWQVLIGLAVLGGLIALLFSNNKPAKKSDDGVTYTVKKSEPQLPPMPYSETTRATETFDGEDWEVTTYSDGSWSAERDVDEPFKTYFHLSDVIRFEKDIQTKLAACEESYKILGEFVRAWLSDSEKLPNTIACRDVGVELYLRLGRWAEAEAAIRKCIAAGAYVDGGLDALNHLERYKAAAQRALAFIKGNPGCLQKNLYKALPEVDRACLKSFARSSMLIRKVKAGATNELYAEV